MFLHNIALSLTLLLGLLQGGILAFVLLFRGGRGSLWLAAFMLALSWDTLGDRKGRVTALRVIANGREEFCKRVP